MCIVYKTDSDQSVSILHSKAKHSTDAYYPVWLCVCLCCFAVCSRNLTSRNVQWISWARAEAILKCKQCVLFIILSTQKPRTSSQLQARWTGINGNAHNLALIAFRMNKPSENRMQIDIYAFVNFNGLGSVFAFPSIVQTKRTEFRIIHWKCATAHSESV